MSRSYPGLRRASAESVDLERALRPNVHDMATTTAPPETISISQAARATGVSAHTLRYERAGLMLDPVDRAESSHRRYTERELTWITLLTRLRGTGMPIRRIAEYAELVRAGDGNEAER